MWHSYMPRRYQPAAEATATEAAAATATRPAPLGSAGERGVAGAAVAEATAAAEATLPREEATAAEAAAVAEAAPLMDGGSAQQLQVDGFTSLGESPDSPSLPNADEGHCGGMRRLNRRAGGTGRRRAVRLHVYRLTNIFLDSALSAFLGGGIFHSGVEVYLFIFMFIFICVCGCVCVCVCMYIHYIYTHTFICIYIYID
ncbi:hypothetical protein T492DRAFT_160134 [Pavlovales sp. CCMP2436]|nr:hypothetical protein T492DRAFT_160134 [Pavlovales sp. CCMP2436]